jgi:excinuclease UvrABC nuclease subunit
MKRIKWGTFGKGNAELDRKLKKKIKPLYRLYKKYDLSYLTICILLSSDESTALTVRAKDSKDEYVTDSYAFEEKA